MMKERLGFKCDEGLIIKYPETVLTAKVTIQKDNKYVAELINYSQLRERIENNNKEKPIKKKLISSMIVFYILLAVLFIYTSGSFMGIFISAYFTLGSFLPLYYILKNIIYALKHKEEVQYANVLRKANACYLTGKKISKENLENIEVIPYIENIENRVNMDYLRQILLIIFTTTILILIPHINFIILMCLDIPVLILYIFSGKNVKLLKLLAKLNEILVYRKPTDEQVEVVLFGMNYLERCTKDDIVKWFFFH